MGRFVKGNIVVIRFPFSDLSGSKKRPALVISVLSGDDIILSQITGKDRKDEYSIPLSNNDFENGSLNKDSNIRPNRLFTADENIIERVIGKISNEKLKYVLDMTMKIIKS